jgi:hypothetical protein
MTTLRKLKQSDAPLMLEWMHDEDVVHFMKADFQHKTLSDCENLLNLHKMIAIMFILQQLMTMIPIWEL